MFHSSLNWIVPTTKQPSPDNALPCPRCCISGRNDTSGDTFDCRSAPDFRWQRRWRRCEVYDGLLGITPALFYIIHKGLDWPCTVGFWPFDIGENFGNVCWGQKRLSDMFHGSLMFFPTKMIRTLVVFLRMIGPVRCRTQYAPLASKQSASGTRPVCNWHGSPQRFMIKLQPKWLRN